MFESEKNRRRPAAAPIKGAARFLRAEARPVDRGGKLVARAADCGGSALARPEDPAGRGTTTVRRRAVAVFYAATVCLLCLASSPGAAAEAIEGEKGFHVGLKFMGSSLHVDKAAGEDFFIKDDGGGVKIDFGYRFNRTFMLELSVGGANHSTSDPAIDARFTEVQIFGYYRFSPQRAFRPYLKGGLGGYSLRVEEGSASVRIEGGGVAFGGGFRYFFSSHFSIGVDLAHNLIRYDNAGIDIESFSYEWAIDEDGAQTSLGVMFGYSF